MFRNVMNCLVNRLVLAIVVIAGCGGCGSAGPTPARLTTEPVVPSPGPEPRTELGPRADVPDSVAGANNRFALELFRRMAEEDGNLAYSPASISTALAMTFAGARGQTATEMAEALELSGLDAAGIHAAFKAQIANWNRDHQGQYQLAVANRAYFDQATPIHDEYTSLLRDSYGAPAERLDFRSSPDPSRILINDWVAAQTQDRIRDLLPTGSVDTSTRLVLANAVYFKGSWQHAFDTALTQPRPFSPHRSEMQQIPTMYQHNTFGYAQTDGVKVLRLPYVGGEFEMVVILPDDQEGLPDLQARLSAEGIEGWIDQTTEQELDVYLPKFTYDPPNTTALGETLQDMGMHLAFGGGDFSGMSSEPLMISEVFHKAFVEVNEEGTEAAAATAVVMAEGAAAAPLEFRADHPFIFLIRDTQSGSWLFVGRIHSIG